MTTSHLIEICCPVCTSNAFKVLYSNTLGDNPPVLGYGFTAEHTKSYRIVRCEECGHGYCSPRPSNMDEHYHDIVDAEYLKNQGQRLQTAEKVIKIIKKYCAAGRLLDIGCSTADFLAAAKEEYAVEGLELSTWAAEIAKTRGFKIHNCTLEDLRAYGNYDIVTLWGVIEHLEHPKKDILKIHKLLKQEGLVCLWTGNIDSVTSKILGKKWWWIMGQHIQFFSEESLDRLLSESGFERLYLGKYPYVMSIGSIARSLNRYPILGKIANMVLNISFIANKRITVSVPGEMFAVYRKARVA